MADDVRVFTVPLDRRTGLFDDRAVRAWLAPRELVRVESHFFTWQDVPAFGMVVVTRSLSALPRGDALEVAGSAPVGERGLEAEGSGRAAEVDARELTRGMDPAQLARYQRLVAWRRQAAHREGLPPYVLLTNAQVAEVAVLAPGTLSGLGAVKGVGAKRLEKHGRAILEVLHGPEPGGGPEPVDPVREVDGDVEVAVRADAADAGDGAAQPEPAD